MAEIADKQMGLGPVNVCALQLCPVELESEFHAFSSWKE